MLLPSLSQPEYVVLLVLGVAHSYLFYHFTAQVPDPYMDEVFHIPQATRFCQGDFQSWDSNITTFPGLYYATTVLFNTLRIPCTSVAAFRAVNAFLISGGSWVCIVQLLRHIHPHTSFQWRTWRCLCIATLPPVFFYYFVFYTDPLATTTVLLLYYVIRKKPMSSGPSLAWLVEFCLCTAALLARQTNVVWIFGAALYKATDLLAQRLPSSSLRSFRWRRGMFDVIVTVLPEALCCLGFLVFVITLNKGQLTLGHQEFHQVSSHTAQLIYLTCVIALFCLPSLIVAVWSLSSHHVLCLSSVFLSLLVPALVFMHMGFILHPFVLADNRHLTFYVMRLVARHSWIRLGVLPSLAAIAWTVVVLSYRNVSWTSVANLVIYVLCCSMVLIPTPLVEPRYLQLPLILWLLHFRSPLEKKTGGQRIPWAECVRCAIGIAIDIAIFTLFFRYPFLYKNQMAGRVEIGRLMP